MVQSRVDQGCRARTYPVCNEIAHIETGSQNESRGPKSLSPRRRQTRELKQLDQGASHQCGRTDDPRARARKHSSDDDDDEVYQHGIQGVASPVRHRTAASEMGGETDRNHQNSDGKQASTSHTRTPVAVHTGMRSLTLRRSPAKGRWDLQVTHPAIQPTRSRTRDELAARLAEAKRYHDA